jgi:hypothetical protein
MSRAGISAAPPVRYAAQSSMSARRFSSFLAALLGCCSLTFLFMRRLRATRAHMLNLLPGAPYLLWRGNQETS